MSLSQRNDLHQTAVKKVQKHIRKAVAEYLDRRIPKACEKTFYSEETNRSKGDVMVNYQARKRVLFREIEKHFELSSELKGYMLLREPKLNDTEWDTIETWTEGSYDFERVSEQLRKLERPAPPSKGNYRLRGTGCSMFTGFQDRDATPDYEGRAEDDAH